MSPANTTKTIVLLTEANRSSEYFNWNKFLRLHLNANQSKVNQHFYTKQKDTTGRLLTRASDFLDFDIAEPLPEYFEDASHLKDSVALALRLNLYVQGHHSIRSFVEEQK